MWSTLTENGIVSNANVEEKTMTKDEAIKFLKETASYFEHRDTCGKDKAHWSNVYNAENCLKIAEMLK